MTNSADPDQLASEESTDLDLHCLQRQGIFGFNRTRVNVQMTNLCFLLFLYGERFDAILHIRDQLCNWEFASLVLIILKTFENKGYN